VRRFSITKFSDIRIRTKLAFGFAAVFGVIAMVAGVGATAVLDVRDSAEEASANGQRLNALSLELQRHLANAQRDISEYQLAVRTSGAQVATETYTLRVRSDLDAARGALAQIIPMVMGTTEEARVLQMTNQIDRFEQEFERLAAAYTSFGTTDSGLEGTFRTQLRTVEDGLAGKTGVEKATAAALAAGRLADDYTARPSDAAAARTTTALGALKNEIDAASGLKPDEKATLRTAAEASTTAFAKLAEAQSAVTSSTTNFSTLVQGIGTTANRIGANGLDASKKAETDIKDTSAAAVRAVLLYTLMGALLAACMVVVLTRTITGRIARLVDASNRMSLGELDVEIPVEGRDEVGQLAESLHRMQASLRAAIERLRARRAAA